ncbi:MAG: M20/M25/M40 family metallo-hydrolase [Ruminococcaceae bacterium]|nr:M20/M25/M40 family metallo-hydrolase [Oscillospiraceae bacterium]
MKDKKLMHAAYNLSRAIRIKTVSNSDISKTDKDEFSAFEAFLAEAYPRFHKELKKTVINKHGLLYFWKGSGDSLPVLITAHYDVVPADDKNWPYPPFSGEIADGKIYGRGALDDKGSLISIIEAAEELLCEGFAPKRDIYFAFGFDEEIGGDNGAVKIAEYLKKQNIKFEYVLDEGGAVADGSMMGIEKPIAVIGIAEKGNSSFRLTFAGEEGHSSAPGKNTAIAKMAKFITYTEEKPPKTRLTPTVTAMLKAIAPYKKGISAKVLSRPEMFEPLIVRIMQKSKQTAAMLKTSIAFTMTDAGHAHNVLPKSASLTANVRILQGESVSSVIKYFRASKIDFDLDIITKSEPTSPSDLDSAGMGHVKACVMKVFPDAVISPYLMTGGTDCRHYQAVAKNTYRFSPMRLKERELSLVHGSGEYLSLDNLEKMIRFYTMFIRGL